MINLYRGISSLTSDVEIRNSISRYLRKLLVEIISKNKGIIGDKYDEAKILEWKKLITKFIDENEKETPYSDLPDAERNILNDIDHYISLEDISSVKRKISELSGMIKVRNDDMKKSKNINRIAIPLAIIGVLFTILFGILALSS